MADGKPQSTNSQSGVTSTSRSLLVRLNEHEEAAWDRLVELYTPPVCHWCRGQRLPEQDLPDVIQEVFKAVSLNIDRFRHDRPGDTFRGWLRTISRSRSTTAFARKATKPPRPAARKLMRLSSRLPTGRWRATPASSPIRTAPRLRKNNCCSAGLSNWSSEISKSERGRRSGKSLWTE